MLISLSLSGLLLEYRTNPQLESALCRFHICATGQLIDTAHARRLEPGPEAAALGAAESLEALRRDPAAAERWADAAEALLLAGRTEPAAYAFRRAVSLAPNSPPILLQAANYHLRTGHPALALPLTARILQLIRDYDPVIFLAYSRTGLPISDLLRLGIPDDPAAARAFFLSSVTSSAPQEVIAVWRHLSARHYDTPPLAARYLDFLLSRHLYSYALTFWTSRHASDPDSLLFNGSFESPFSGARLDWTPSKSPHVTETRDSTLTHSGNWSLRLDFDGAENLDYRGISQTAIVSPGRYQLRAWLRIDGALTTDRGLFIRAFDPESPAHLDVRTTAFTSAPEWTPIDLPILVPAVTHLLQIQLCREPSWKFDNKIAGTARLDSFQLTGIK